MSCARIFPNSDASVNNNAGENRFNKNCCLAGVRSHMNLWSTYTSKS